jgi:hypothetical protein
VCIYVYIYMYSKYFVHEGKRTLRARIEVAIQPVLQASKDVYTYLYIYIYIYIYIKYCDHEGNRTLRATNIYIYIYIYVYQVLRTRKEAHIKGKKRVGNTA